MADNKMSAAAIAARRNIPASALADMEKVGSYDVMRDARAYGFATGGPASAIPPDYSKQASKRGANVPGNGSGWRSQREFGEDGQHPTPGVSQCDRLMDAADAKDKAELMAKLTPQSPAGAEQALELAMTLLKNQQELIAKLTAKQDKKSASKR